MKTKHYRRLAAFAIVLAIALYCGADILIRVRALNDLTPPWPIGGIALGLSLAAFLWIVILGPIISFMRLGRGAGSTRSRTKAALRELEAYQHCEHDPDPAKQAKFARWQAIYNASVNAQEKLPELLAEYANESELHRKAMQFVHSSCKAAAIGTVISRNKFLDGLVLLYIQMKLIVNLARMYGYKPSLVFNTLCFSWALSNSMIFALMSGAALDAGQAALDEQVIDPAMESIKENLFEPVADYLQELIGIEVGAALGGAIPILGGALNAGSRIAMEAILAILPVYVTGRVFLMRLEGDARKVDMKMLVNLRREGRSAMWDIWKNQAEKAPATV